MKRKLGLASAQAYDVSVIGDILKLFVIRSVMNYDLRRQLI
jgi:hypothetical protein